MGLVAFSVQAQPFKHPPYCVTEYITAAKYEKRVRPFQFAIAKTQEGWFSIHLSAAYSPDDYGEAKYIRVMISNVEPPVENNEDKDYGYIFNAQKDIEKTFDVPLPSKDQRMTLLYIPVRSSEMQRAILSVCYLGKDGMNAYVARLCRFTAITEANQALVPTATSVTPAADAPVAPAAAAAHL